MSDWKNDLNPESIQKSVDAGNIYPNLKIAVGETKKVLVLTEPTEFKDKEGKPFFTMQVEIEDGTKFSLGCAKSLRFHLSVEMKKNKLTTPVGMWFTVGKQTADLSAKGLPKDAKVYFVQYVGENP